MKKGILIGLVICSVWGLAGCVSTVRFPEWAGKNWRENGWIYFSGISDPTTDIAAARQMAYARALASAGEYVGVTVSVTTQSTLSTVGQDFTSRLNAQTAEVLWAEGEVKEFRPFCQSGVCTGYLVLGFQENRLRKAQADLRAKQEQAQQRRRQNARSGPWRVQTAPEWSELTGAVEKHLLQLGFQIQPNGKPLWIHINQFQCRSLAGCGLVACSVTAKLELPFGERAITVSAYGNNREQAVWNLIGEWERKIDELFSENI